MFYTSGVAILSTSGKVLECISSKSSFSLKAWRFKNKDDSVLNAQESHFIGDGESVFTQTPSESEDDSIITVQPQKERNMPKINGNQTSLSTITSHSKQPSFQINSNSPKEFTTTESVLITTTIPPNKSDSNDLNQNVLDEVDDYTLVPQNQESTYSSFKDKVYVFEDHPPDHLTGLDYYKRHEQHLKCEEKVLASMKKSLKKLIYKFNRVNTRLRIKDFSFNSISSYKFNKIEKIDILENDVQPSIGKNVMLKKFRGNEEVQDIYTSANRIHNAFNTIIHP